MQKHFAGLLVFLFVLTLVFGLSACANDTGPAIGRGEPAEPGRRPDGADYFPAPIVVAFQTISARLFLPEDWEVLPQPGSALPGVERSYNLQFIPPGGNVRGIVTIGNTMQGQARTAQELSTWHGALAEQILPRAVEETAEYDSLDFHDGIAMLSIFTDAALVGTTPPANEYLYFGMFLGSWGDGFLVRASLVTNDRYCPDFTQMLGALHSMELTLNPVRDSLSLEDWDKIRTMPQYDLGGLNLLGHDLSNSEFFEEYTLESGQNGQGFSVPVIIGGAAYRPYRHGTDEVIWNAGGIAMLYYLLPRQEVAILLDAEVSRDISRLENDGFFIYAQHPLRLCDGGSAAAFGLYLKLQGVPNAVYIYLLQDMPDSDETLLLLLILFPEHWGEEDPLILTQLGEYIGIDLLAYWPW